MIVGFIRYAGVVWLDCLCSPSSIDHIYVLKFVLHEQIYVETSTKNRFENCTSFDLVMVIESACV
jgi:hypothetical protein